MVLRCDNEPYLEWWVTEEPLKLWKDERLKDKMKVIKNIGAAQIMNKKIPHLNKVKLLFNNSFNNELNFTH